jgi:dCMP deaminase
MFIGIIGPKSSGKHTIVEYLLEQHNFEFLTIRKNVDTFNRNVYLNAKTFDNADDVQAYVTERWQDNFVICDIDCEELDVLRYRRYKRVYFVFTRF